MASARERADSYVLRDNGSVVPEIVTMTSTEQRDTELKVLRFFRLLNDANSTELHQLKRESHLLFLSRRLHSLPTSFDSLDASQPWLCYWTVHALHLLGGSGTLRRQMISADERNGILRLLASCQSPTGGFGGGPHQMSHLATTYGAVNCLCILAEDDPDEALGLINRTKLREWLRSLRTHEGAFRLQEDGEVDVRGVYCALSVAKLTGLLQDNLDKTGSSGDDHESLFQGTAEWLKSCQTYEGGFAAAPGLEAHGGYTFCGFAALFLLGKAHTSCDLSALLRWAVNRQRAFEGGFNGRTNKLVDSCYSWWVGGLFPLLHRVLQEQGDPALSADNWLFDVNALQEYLLLCCQRQQGGMVDKPGRNPDPYHCCYALSGLSAAQHFEFAPPLLGHNALGGDNNLLCVTDPVHNIGVEFVDIAVNYFRNRSL